MKRYRKHIRLKGFDYRSAGYYFVTTCTNFRLKLFEPRVSKKYGHAVPKHVVDVVAPSYGAQYSNIFEENLEKLGNIYSNIEIDFYCLMPNHAHLIVVILDKATNKAAYDAATTDEFKTADLPGFITALKSCTTRGAKAAGFKGKSLWQPNYYEHIIRKEEHLDAIRRYILANPNVEYESINWKKLDPL